MQLFYKAGFPLPIWWCCRRLSFYLDPLCSSYQEISAIVLHVLLKLLQ